MRIIEILIQKEEQALKNIGDPALLLGKFNVEEEETVIAEAIESGSDADTFAQSPDADAQEFNPFEALMAAASETEETAIEQLSETVSDETLFTDKEYLEQAVQYLNQTDSNPVQESANGFWPRYPVNPGNGAPFACASAGRSHAARRNTAPFG